MRLSSIEVVLIEVVFRGGCLTNVYYLHIAQISSFGTFPGGGGWEQSIIKLISAEAEALIGLAELGNNSSFFYFYVTSQ